MTAEHSTPDLLSQEAAHLGIDLAPTQLELFSRYYDELIAWNEKMNLTAILAWEPAQVQHFLDSLSAALVLPERAQEPGYSIVDIGAGAGFPGVPLKILLPRARLALIEAVVKKARFLEHLVKVLGLNDVRVLPVRAEEAGRDPAQRENYDLAVARAVAELPVLLEYALPLVRVGGQVVAHKGREVEEEVAASQAALAALGGTLVEVRAVHLPGLEGPRHLVVVQKTEPTPERYPRRVGIPAKRPL